MSDRDKPKVGQVLYSLNVGNAARRTKQALTPVVVTKVGRKYFSTAADGKDWRSDQFHISDWTEKTEYTPSQRLYECERDWLDERDARELHATIKRAFNCYSPSLPLSKLREIHRIVAAEHPHESEGTQDDA